MWCFTALVFVYCSISFYVWVSGWAALKPLCRRESVSRPVPLPDQTHIHLRLPGCRWPLLSGVELTFTLASVNSLARHRRPPSLCGHSQDSVLLRDDERLGALHQRASQSPRVHTVIKYSNKTSQTSHSGGVSLLCLSYMDRGHIKTLQP